MKTTLTLFVFSICYESHFIYGLVNPVAFYPFDDKHNAADISCHSNQEGKVFGAKLTVGPTGSPKTAYDFAASPKNYIELPGTTHTDTRYSTTILVWIYHSGFSGPIVDYADDGFGVNLWMTGKDTLYGRIISRDGTSSQVLSSNQVGLQYSWHFVGMSYDYNTGKAALWVDGVIVQELYVGSIELKTSGLLRLGALSTDDRYFRGKMACLQIYDEALTTAEIYSAKRRCEKRVLDCSDTSSVDCGGEISTLPGTITSPRYPREYPPNTECVWKLSVSKGKQIIVRFRNIDLEKDKPDCGDYIEVFDGLNSWSPRLVKYCNTPDSKDLQLSSKSNTMRIQFNSNSENEGKGFSAYFTSQNIEKSENKTTLDLSVHYTGIVIGVACAALFAALTIIAINHTKQSRRRRRNSTLSSRQRRRSESLSVTDIIVQGAPPSYDIVMRCPALYPPSPQSSPASIHSALRSGLHGPSPLSSRTGNVSASSLRFNGRSSNGLSEDSDEEDPPPYPGVAAAQMQTLPQQVQHSNQTNAANSTPDNSSIHQLHDTHSYQALSNGVDSVQGNTTDEAVAGTNAAIRGEERDGNPTSTVQQNELELIENPHNHDSQERHTAENVDQTDGSVLPSYNTAAMVTNNEDGICTCDVEIEDGRPRQDSQNSIIGTVV